MPPRSQQGESKQGLIITVVIAFLLVICLGVTTYFGYSEQDKFVGEAKKANQERDTFKDERDYYKDQAMLYRAYMGMAEGMDGADTLGTVKNQLEGGSVGKAAKDKADVTKTLETLKTKYGWEGNQPKETLEGTIQRLTTELENQRNLNKRTTDSLTKTQGDLRKRDEDLANARKEFEDQLKKEIDSFKQDFAKLNQDLIKCRAELDKVSQDRDSVRTQAEEAKKTLEATIAKRERDISELKSLVERKEGELAEMRAKSPTTPASMRTDWKIVRVDNRGANAYINLGSADRVRPPLTFNIHGVGADGRPSSQSKGTLEVVNVISPHLSLARITSVKDPSRNPIIVNDVVYNASWNPNIKKHVAIAGIIDLTGDGRDSLDEFIRNLERENIVVDAYVNPKDGQIKGQLTYQTDFLILGDVPDRAVGSGSDESEKRILESRKLMQDEAKKYGVPIKNLLSYLEMIGYPLPRSARGDRASPSNRVERSDIVPRLSRERFQQPAAPSNTNPPPTPTPPNK